MTPGELADIRAAANALRAYEKSAAGMVSGARVANVRAAERELRALLWKHRDALIASAVAAESAGRGSG